MVGGYNLRGRGGCGNKPGEPACILEGRPSLCRALGATWWRWPVLLGAGSPRLSAPARARAPAVTPSSHQCESAACGTRGTRASDGQG